MYRTGKDVQRQVRSKVQVLVRSIGQRISVCSRAQPVPLEEAVTVHVVCILMRAGAAIFYLAATPKEHDHRAVSARCRAVSCRHLSCVPETGWQDTVEACYGPTLSQADT